MTKINKRKAAIWLNGKFMFNTIILLRGEAGLTNSTEMKRFEKGDIIWGVDSEPEELKRWSIDQKEEAEKELEKYRCSYRSNGHMTWVVEYALDFTFGLTTRTKTLGNFMKI